LIDGAALCLRGRIVIVGALRLDRAPSRQLHGSALEQA